MAWICVGCSKEHMDSMENMGFGLCKTCEGKAKEERAKTRAAYLSARKARAAQYNKK